MLVAEVEELLHRGPARQYVPMSRKLESPRGRILVEALARQGGIREARLPCRYFERHINWHLNQVLRAGLDLAARMTNDREQRRHLHRLLDEFEQVERPSEIRGEDIDKAQRDLTRLTNAYGGAISIIRLLCQMQGVTFELKTRPHSIPGFLFDMNFSFRYFYHVSFAKTSLASIFQISGQFDPCFLMPLMQIQSGASRRR